MQIDGAASLSRNSGYGADSEWREKFLNIGKNPWEIERKPVPDESEADPSPNTGNNWHSGSNSTGSLAAERARNLTIGREGRSASSFDKKPVVHLDDLYIEHPSDFPLRFDALYRRQVRRLALLWM